MCWASTLILWLQLDLIFFGKSKKAKKSIKGNKRKKQKKSIQNSMLKKNHIYHIFQLHTFRANVLWNGRGKIGLFNLTQISASACMIFQSSEILRYMLVTRAKRLHLLLLLKYFPPLLGNYCHFSEKSCVYLKIFLSKYKVEIKMQLLDISHLNTFREEESEISST